MIAGVDLATQENSIRDLINLEAPLRTVLRLICVYSLISGGIKQKLLEEFKRDLLQVGCSQCEVWRALLITFRLQTYGFDYLPLLLALERLDVLTRAPASSRSAPKPPFAQCRKPLRLIVDDVDEQNPQDPSYVFSGYAPLSVRLVQTAVTPAGVANGVSRGSNSLNGWRGIEEIVRTLPGATFDERQKADDMAMQRRAFRRCDVIVAERELTGVSGQSLRARSRLRSFASSVASLSPRSRHYGYSTGSYLVSCLP